MTSQLTHHTPLVLAVITARGGSKGLPGKNVKLLGGKPLIAYSIDAAKKSKLITHTIVSTDDPEIAAAATAAGGDVPFIRPPELARDTTPHAPVMQHAIAFMEHKLGVVFDYIVTLQPTSPFRAADDLDGTIQKLIDTGADSAVSVVEVEAHEHPIKMKKLEGDRVLPYCIEEKEGVRRQDLPPCYRRSAAVYVVKRDIVMNENKMFGDHIVGYVVPRERSIDIDTPRDWLMAEYLYNNLLARGFFK